MARVRVRGKKRRVKTISQSELEARAKYQPKIGAVRGQIAESKAFQKRIPSFYDAYRQELTGQQAAMDQRVQAQAQAAESQRAALQSTENAEYKRVHGIDAPIQAEKESQAATQARQVAQGVVSGIFGAQKGTSYVSQQQAVQKERDRRAGLRGELAGLRAEKGAYKYQVKAKLSKERQAARFKRASLALAQYRAQISAQQGAQRIAISEANLAESQREHRRQGRLSRARIRTTRRGQSLSYSTQQQRLAQAGSKAQRGSSRDAFNTQVAQAIQIITSSRDKKILAPMNEGGRDPAKLVRQLVARGIDARAAVEAIKSLTGG